MQPCRLVRGVAAPGCRALPQRWEELRGSDRAEGTWGNPLPRVPGWFVFPLGYLTSSRVSLVPGPLPSRCTPWLLARCWAFRGSGRLREGPVLYSEAAESSGTGSLRDNKAL